MLKSRLPAFELALSSILLGLGAIFVVVIALDPVSIAFYRLLLGGLFFGGFLLVRRQSFAINRRGLCFASLAGLMFGTDLALWNQSIVLIGPGVATILNSLQVFFMAGFGILFFREIPTLRLLLSLLLGFAGVVLLCSPEMGHGEGGTFGVVVGILSGLAFALSMIAMRVTATYQKHSLFNTMFYSSLAGALALGVWVWLGGRSFLPTDSQSWGLIVIYSLGVHVLAWALMAKSLPLLKAALVGLIFCLEPVVAMAVDVLFLDKNLSFWQLAGAGLTLTAIYLGNQPSRK